MAKRRSVAATRVAHLRTVAWVVVALALHAASTHPGPGGGQVGVLLAAALTTCLIVTRKSKHHAKGRKR